VGDFLLLVPQRCSASRFIFGASGLCTNVNGCDTFGHGLVSFEVGSDVFGGVLRGMLAVLSKARYNRIVLFLSQHILC
jgi:hypothetical protein